MRKLLFLSIALLGTLPLVACNQSPQGGAAGTTESFRVTAPSMTTTITQGDRQTVDLDVKRGSNFKQAVKLEAQAPDGIKAELGSKMIHASDPEKVSLTIEADSKASIGEQIIKVVATPETGAATSVDVKVKVEPKK
jgi:uncharacterized membrane protein